MFIDSVKIEVESGKGGDGAISFHTEKFVPKGGPDGGKGGSGGNIIAYADPQLTTLLDYRYKRKYKAMNGNPGGASNKTGKNGKDVVLRLPVGTLISNFETGELIIDLNEPEDKVVIAKGGKGGHGNAHYKSATNQAPRKAQNGQPAEKLTLALELKLLADVGLVGLPNAGKSTILSSFSAARPKIADYPFTTLVPNLGIVKLREYKSCVMADIPGLIEGAAAGKGLGHQFLKHIQRTRLLIYVIDINEEDIEKTKKLLISELGDFDKTLLERRAITVVTKLDTLSESDFKTLSNKHPDDYIYISAVSGAGKNNLLREIEMHLDKERT